MTNMLVVDGIVRRYGPAVKVLVAMEFGIFEGEVLREEDSAPYNRYYELLEEFIVQAERS